MTVESNEATGRIPAITKRNRATPPDLAAPEWLDGDSDSGHPTFDASALGGGPGGVEGNADLEDWASEIAAASTI